jgi:hypothetical protein
VTPTVVGAAHTLVLEPLYYLIAAVVVAVLLGLVVSFRHRRPKSLEANMESFNRGLQALSPNAPPSKRRGRRAPSPAHAATAERARAAGSGPASGGVRVAVTSSGTAGTASRRPAVAPPESEASTG